MVSSFLKNTARVAAAVAFSALLFAANAAPHNGEEFSLRQPDGSLVRVIVWGDEFYQDVETPDGYTLVRDKDGWICYAELSADGSEYVSTGVRYTVGSRAAASRKGLRVHKNTVREKQRGKRAFLGYDELVAPPAAPPRPLGKSAALPDGISPAPLATPRRVVGITLLIDFPDQKSNVTRDAMDDFCNRRGGFNGTNPAGSTYDYFYDVSNGLLEYTNIVTPFITVDSNKTYYDRGTDYKYVPELITSALNKLKAMNFDLSEVTTAISGSGNNRRETVTALNIFYAGSPTQGWAGGIWPHSGTYRAPSGQTAVTINGVGFGKYQLSSLGTGGSPPGIGTFVHENGHMILGWPDLYSYESPTHSNGVGNWCVMNSSNGTHPQQPNAYLRSLAGWIDVTDITDAGYDAPDNIGGEAGKFSHAANGHTAYLFRNTDQKFYVIEARRRVSASADPRNSAIPGSGLAIWQINTRGDNTSSEKVPLIALVQADGKNDLERKANGGDATDLYRLRVNTAFNMKTVPAPDDSKINLVEISDSGAVMTFRIMDAAGRPAPKWYMTVAGGDGSGYYGAGECTRITAPEENADGRRFLRWTSAALESLDVYSYTTIAVLPPLPLAAQPADNPYGPAAEATVTAQFVRGFNLPGQVEADTGYLQGFRSASNTANGATGNRIAQVSDTGRFAEYSVDVTEDGLYKLSYRLLTSSSSAGKFILSSITDRITTICPIIIPRDPDNPLLLKSDAESDDMRRGVVLDTVTVPTSARTAMQTVEGKTVSLNKGRAVFRIERESGSYGIDWFAAELTGPTPVVVKRERAPLAYGLRASSSGRVSFQVPGAEYVSVKVYDMRGRLAAVLCDGVKNAGAYNVNISPRGGAGLSRGFYIVSMKSGKYSKSVRVGYGK